MFQYEDLGWLISFPLVCAAVLWWSLDLAVLTRVSRGRRRRANAQRAIEHLIANSPITLATPTNGSSSLAERSPHRLNGHRAPELTTSGGGGDVDGTGNGGKSGSHDSLLERQRTVFATGGAGAESTPFPSLSQQPQKGVRQVVVPTALRIATRAVVRRAVVLVGGDFARSPRMQYHAASLARCGLFDEVLLVGLDYGNRLSENLLDSGEPQPEHISVRDGLTAATEMEHVRSDSQTRPGAPEPWGGRTGCIITTCYLTAPPVPPEWLQTVFPLLSLHWVACTLYRVIVLSFLFTLNTMRATAARINEHGQLLLTDVILVQTPPAVPFVLLVKYVVCPLVFLHNMLLYYGVVVPAAWMYPSAMRDVCEQCQLQSLRSPPVKKPSMREPLEGLSLCSRMRAGASRCARAPRAVLRPAVVVDWHNLGHTILEQQHRPNIAVRVYKFFEMHLCAGDVNITVSQAMCRALQRAYWWLRYRADAAAAGLPGSAPSPIPTGGVTVLYDVAPAFFHPGTRARCLREVLEPLRRHRSDAAAAPSHVVSTTSAALIDNGRRSTEWSTAELEKLGWGIAGPPSWVYEDVTPESPTTMASFLRAPDPFAAASAQRGLILVGSTSWTEDEDYSILVEALQRLDQRLQHHATYAAKIHPRSSHNSATEAGSSSSSSNPDKLWVLITGKGPTRSRFENAVKMAKLSSCVVVSTYYAQSYQAYSLLLGAADIGLCLHFSSSGLDLPMKGVDMAGAGLPIIALQYPAIGELMGGVTRVLATASMPISVGKAASGSLARSPAKTPQPSLQECERGWLFRTSADLENLLASFVGLTATREDVSHGLAQGQRTLPTPLSVMKRRAVEARHQAPTWEDNWNRVLRPVLQQLV